MGIKRHGFPVRVLALATVLAVHTAACAGSTTPYAAAPPSPTVTKAAAATAISAADTPTQPVATTPTARSWSVEEESDMTLPPTVSDVELPAEAERVIQLASKDLAQRLGLALEQIAVVSVHEVQWPDTSLGCPRPGEVYAQIITPGYRVLLVAQEQHYQYHTDAAGLVVLCERPPDLKVPPPKSADDRKPWQPVDNDPRVIIP